MPEETAQRLVHCNSGFFSMLGGHRARISPEAMSAAELQYLEPRGLCTIAVDKLVHTMR